MPLAYSNRPSCSVERLSELLKKNEPSFSRIKCYASMDDYLKSHDKSEYRKVFCGSLYLLGEYIQQTDTQMLIQI